MKKNSTRKEKKKQREVVVGLDLGDRWSHYYALGEDGESVRGRVGTSRNGIQEWVSKLPGGSLVVMEVGTHSSWVSREVQAAGHRALVADARRLELISRNQSKSDREDAELLARLGRADAALLRPIQHRGESAQQDLVTIRSRDGMVRARTQLINTVRGLVKSAGSRVGKCSAEAFATRAALAIPPGLETALLPLVKMIGSLSEQIAVLDELVEGLAEKYPETKRLRQIKGVGALTAVAYVLTLEDPKRFARSRQAGAYLGMTPARSQSGERDPQRRISKAGNGYLRRLLVGSAHYILGPHGPSTALREWGQRLAERGGDNGKKRAVVAVARKLAVLLHRLWVSGAVYQPFPQPAPVAA
jgi:transposase